MSSNFQQYMNGQINRASYLMNRNYNSHANHQIDPNGNIIIAGDNSNIVSTGKCSNVVVIENIVVAPTGATGTTGQTGQTSTSAPIIVFGVSGTTAVPGITNVFISGPNLVPAGQTFGLTDAFSLANGAEFGDITLTATADPGASGISCYQIVEIDINGNIIGSPILEFEVPPNETITTQPFTVQAGALYRVDNVPCAATFGLSRFSRYTKPNARFSAPYRRNRYRQF